MAGRLTLFPPLLLIALLAVGPAHAGEPDLEEPDVDVGTAIRASIRRYNELTDYPLPELDAGQLEALVAGEVVRTSRRQAIPGDDDTLRYRALAFLVVERSLPRVWLGIHDPHFADDSSYTHVLLEENDEGSSVSYGHAALPWPVRDRHWVVKGRRGAGIAAATGNRIWEYGWNLAEDGRARAKAALEDGLIPGLGAKTMRKAIYLPASTGAWTVMALDDGADPERSRTLLAYQVTLDLGGWISEKLVASFARRQLERLLRMVALNAARVPYHYGEEHEPVLGGDLEPVPPMTP